MKQLKSIEDIKEYLKSDIEEFDPYKEDKTKKSRKEKETNKYNINEKLKKSILNKSKDKNINKAIEEWKFDSIIKPISKKALCECGYKSHKQYVVLTNNTTNKELIFGYSCYKKFNDETTITNKHIDKCYQQLNYLQVYYNYRIVLDCIEILLINTNLVESIEEYKELANNGKLAEINEDIRKYYNIKFNYDDDLILLGNEEINKFKSIRNHYINHGTEYEKGFIINISERFENKKYRLTEKQKNFIDKLVTKYDKNQYKEFL